MVLLRDKKKRSKMLNALRHSFGRDFFMINIYTTIHLKNNFKIKRIEMHNKIIIVAMCSDLTVVRGSWASYTILFSSQSINIS